MDEVKVYTNNHKREIIYGYELSHYGLNMDEIKSDFDWLDDFDVAEFFIYKNQVYCLQDFLDVHNKFYNPNPPNWLKPWNGYSQDTFFSGVVVKYPFIDNEESYGIDTEHVVVGWYCS